MIESHETLIIKHKDTSPTSHMFSSHSFPCILSEFCVDVGTHPVGKGWAAPRTGTRAPCGTESQLVPVRSGLVSRKLPRARSRNPTFPGVEVSGTPCLAGVPRTTAPTAARGSRTRSSTSFTSGPVQLVPETDERGPR